MINRHDIRNKNDLKRRNRIASNEFDNLLNRGKALSKKVDALCNNWSPLQEQAAIWSLTYSKLEQMKKILATAQTKRSFPAKDLPQYQRYSKDVKNVINSWVSLTYELSPAQLSKYFKSATNGSLNKLKTLLTDIDRKKILIEEGQDVGSYSKLIKQVNTQISELEGGLKVYENVARKVASLPLEQMIVKLQDVNVSDMKAELTALITPLKKFSALKAKSTAIPSLNVPVLSQGNGRE